MIELIGFMVAAYGVTRLTLASDLLKLDATGNRVIGLLGIAALVLLAVMLAEQANTITGIGSGI